MSLLLWGIKFHKLINNIDLAPLSLAFTMFAFILIKVDESPSQLMAIIYFILYIFIYYSTMIINWFDNLCLFCLAMQLKYQMENVMNEYGVSGLCLHYEYNTHEKSSFIYFILIE